MSQPDAKRGCFRAANRFECGKEAERHEERQQPIDDEQPTHADEARRDRKQQRAPEGRALAETAPTDQVDDQNGAVNR